MNPNTRTRRDPKLNAPSEANSSGGPEDYRTRQEAMDREYRAAWKSLPAKDRQRLKRNGIKSPVYHETGLESKPRALPGAKLPSLTCPPSRRDGGFPVFEGIDDEHGGGPESKPRVVLADHDPDPLVFREDMEKAERLEGEDYDALLPRFEDTYIADIHRIIIGASPNVTTRALAAKWGVSPAAISKAASKMEAFFRAAGVPIRRPTARGDEYRARCRASKIRYHRERGRNAAVAKGGVA